MEERGEWSVGMGYSDDVQIDLVNVMMNFEEAEK